MSIAEINWIRYPTVQQSANGLAWLTIQANLGLAANTLDVYARALHDYFGFSIDLKITPDTANKAHIAAYVRDMFDRPASRPTLKGGLEAKVGLSNATIQQRLTALRLYYDYLIEEGLRVDNPVGRGRYTPGRIFGNSSERGLVARQHTLPWIPTEEQWRAILEAACLEPIRNRVMLALAYDAALRREELCSIQTSDIDPTHRTLRIRAETTKSRQERIVPYSAPTSNLYASYLASRREMSRERGPLFLSESRRNKAQPISIWTWSKVVERLAQRSGVEQLTTHTFRHLCLTDLARAGWELHEIARFAGHRNIQTTLLYIHLSAGDLSARLTSGMAQIHNWRTKMLVEKLG